MNHLLVSAAIAILCLQPAYANEERAKMDIKSIELKTLEGKKISGKDLTGKVLLVVNTASRCGYTPQLKELQDLHAKYNKKGLMVIGVPSNDFNQEDLGGDELAKFCKFNYGVEFTMLEKTSVKGPKRHPLYQYLVTRSSTPNEEVGWNFEKFLVNSSGEVVGRYKSGVKPQDPQLIAQIESSLAQKGAHK